MVNNLDDIIEAVYSEIHHFLISKVGEDLDHDLIDINVELKDKEELFIEISLYLELSTFSNQEVQKIAEDAIKKGISTADQVCPSYIVKIKQS